MRVPMEMIAARSSDPATSQTNKDAFVKKMSQRDMILFTYHRFVQTNVVPFMFGMTDEEVGRHTKIDGQSMYDLRICYWKRCSELRKLGFIHATGETRLSSAGQPQQVCVLTERGRNYVVEKFCE